MQDKAKRYSNIKYGLSVAGLVYTLLLLFLVLKRGFSTGIVLWLSETLPDFLILPTYLFLIFSGYYFLEFPFNFYQSYVLEHKFLLSNQPVKDWWFDQVKSGALSYVFVLILVSAFYVILRNFPGSWWLVVSAFWILFSI